MERVYPNGVSGVKHFHAVGCLGFIIKQLLNRVLLHENVKTVMGDGLRLYTKGSKLTDNGSKFIAMANESKNENILQLATKP